MAGKQRKPFEPGPVLKTGVGREGRFSKPSSTRGHNPNDTDTEPRAGHHTLGEGPNQAVRGSDYKKFREENNLAHLLFNQFIDDLEDEVVFLQERCTNLEEAIANQEKSFSFKSTVTVTAENVIHTHSIVFPVGLFTMAPRVFVQPEHNSPENIFVSPSNVTATGFDIRAIRKQGTDPFIVAWEASGG